MKNQCLTGGLAILMAFNALAFDVKKASTDRFKVSYVEPKELPSLTKIPEKFIGRTDALKSEKRLIAAAVDPQVLEEDRRESLRWMYFPIRVVDMTTGSIYEVQTDRRTIIAKTKEGKLLWKVNPFVDAGLRPYRCDFPYIVYFGAPITPLKSEAKEFTLQITFVSSQAGGINIKNGKFTMWGQD